MTTDMRKISLKVAKVKSQVLKQWEREREREKERKRKKKEEEEKEKEKEEKEKKKKKKRREKKRKEGRKKNNRISLGDSTSAVNTSTESEFLERKKKIIKEIIGGEFSVGRGPRMHSGGFSDMCICAEKKGASNTMIGMIFGCYAIFELLASLVFGKYLVHIGAKFMFIAGMFISGGVIILFGVLDQLPDGPIFIVMCFLVRIVDAIGFGAAITASSSILAKAFPNNVATVT
ncbi:hypothetical protein STEG23_031946, partial [Scotinomys teguina]